MGSPIFISGVNGGESSDTTVENPQKWDNLPYPDIELYSLIGNVLQAKRIVSTFTIADTYPPGKN